jgi:hypothetical protein
LLQQVDHGIDVRFDFRHRIGVVFRRGHLQQVGGILATGGQFFDSVNDALQGGALPAQFLRPARVVPDAGFGQFQFYFGQAFLAIIEVKDTP